MFAHGTANGAAHACRAAAAGRFGGAAAGAATFAEPVGEFADLRDGFITVGQFREQRLQFPRRRAKEMKVQRPAIEQMLDIDQRGGRSSFL